VRGRRGPRLHRPRPRRRGHRHAPVAPAHRGRGAEGPAARARGRRAHGARHRLPPEPLGAGGPRRGRGALHRKRRGHGQAAGAPAALRPDRRHGRGVPHRRRHHRHHRRPARRPRRHARHARLQARPMGAAAFTGAIPDTLDDGEAGPGFPIEVFNVLGAGDGFMSGLLKGWLDGEAWPVALTYANACGAFAVSRHGCAPAYPSWEELRFFLARGVRPRPCARTRRWNRCTGPRPAGRLVEPARLRLRPPRADRGRCRAPRPRRSARSSASASTPASRWRTGARATASSATPASGATRSGAQAGRASGSGGRWNGRARAR
jgi:hypothetical protein